MTGKFRVGRLAAALLLLVAGLSASVRTEAAENTEFTFPANISIEGMSLEGMTEAEAETLVSSYVEQLLSRNLTVTVWTDTYQYEADQLEMSWDNTDIVQEAASYVDRGNFISAYKKEKELEKHPVNLKLEISCNTDFIQTEIANLASYFSCDPQEPSVVFDTDGKPVVVQAVDGRTFDCEEILQNVLLLVNNCNSTAPIFYEFPYEEIKPKYTGEELVLSDQPLGEFTTSSLGYETRRKNIELSCANMNGTIIGAGETGSALTMYGDVTPENGYQLAGTYVDGRQDSGYGGGICQTTTTLYNAVLRAELEVTCRRQHSMMVDYVDPSLDAMVDYEHKYDFTFVNNLETPIYIESFADLDADTVTVRIWGMETRPENRTISFVSQVIYVQQPEPLCEVVTDDTICKVGLYMSSEKQKMEVQPHPQIESKAFKIVTVNGIMQSETELSHDQYGEMEGLCYKASDCDVVVSVIPDSSTARGFHYQVDTFFIDTTQIWDPNLVPYTYRERYPDY